MGKAQYLGIDIGGNHVKWGVVCKETGVITQQNSEKTASFKGENFIKSLIKQVTEVLNQGNGNETIAGIGIGLPGTLSKNLDSGVEITAIPELNGMPLLSDLKAAFPNQSIRLANDANAAALGELFFHDKVALSQTSDEKTNVLPDSYIFITLGTGIGSAAIINRKIFTGGDGNALEFGHIVSRGNRTLEKTIGKQGLINLIERRLKTCAGNGSSLRGQPISATNTIHAARYDHDVFAQGVLSEAGEILGEGLVTLVRILDIKTILIGGGLSAAFDALLPGINSSLHRYLTPYYKDIVIRKAVLGNDAGILGAASLCFEEGLTFALPNPDC